MHRPQVFTDGGNVTRVKGLSLLRRGSPSVIPVRISPVTGFPTTSPPWPETWGKEERGCPTATPWGPDVPRETCHPRLTPVIDPDTDTGRGEGSTDMGPPSTLSDLSCRVGPHWWCTDGSGSEMHFRCPRRPVGCGVGWHGMGSCPHPPDTQYPYVKPWWETRLFVSGRWDRVTESWSHSVAPGGRTTRWSWAPPCFVPVSFGTVPLPTGGIGNPVPTVVVV